MDAESLDGLLGELDQVEPGEKDSRAESRGLCTDLWWHEASSGSDDGHRLVVALLVGLLRGLDDGGCGGRVLASHVN